MKITEVTIQDGSHCAAVINALNIAKFDGLTGKDLEVLVDAKKWLRQVALQMATELKSAHKSAQSPAPVQPAPAMKIKAMGPITSGGSIGKSKTKKK